MSLAAQRERHGLRLKQTAGDGMTRFSQQTACKLRSFIKYVLPADAPTAMQLVGHKRLNFYLHRGPALESSRYELVYTVWQYRTVSVASEEREVYTSLLS